MSRILKITFFILNIIYGEEEENRRNSLFLNAKFGNDNNTYISRVYSSLCDIIKGKNFEILEKKDLIDNEKKFIISTFKIIDNLLLDESKDPSDLISMIINFPSLRNSIIDKKNAEILFTVKFIQFIFFLEDIEDFSSIFQQTKYDFPTESEISVDTEEKKAMELLNNRIDMFFSISDEMLKKNNHEYWKISKILEFTESLFNKERGEQSESSEKKNLIDNLNEIFISNDFLRVSNKTTNFAFSEDELKTDNDVTSFVTISSFCIQKIFKYLVPQKKTTLDENNVIYELGNLLDRKIPNEGEIYVPNEENKLLLEFIARLFYCLKSYSPESICINVSNYEKDLKISFSIQRNSWNLISESNSVMIRYLCLLNQILHRKYREYYINKISIDNLIMYGNEIYNEVIMQSNKMESNENIKTTGSLRKKGSLRKGQFISHTGSLGRTSSVRKRLSHLFRNPTDKQKNDSFEMFDEVKAKEDFDKQKLIEALQKFNNSINHEEIDSFLHFNASMNNCDLLIAVGTKKFPGFFEVINYFVDYGTSGYSIDLQSDALYITKKAEIDKKMESLSKEEYDLEAIKSYFKIDILNEKDEVMISGALLLSMASYFNIPHSQSVYDCLILLRRYIEGNLHNKENFNRKEVINVILRSIEINRKRSRYLSRLIYIKLREMMKK